MGGGRAVGRRCGRDWRGCHFQRELLGSVGVGWVNAQSPLRAFLLPIFSQHVGGCRENFSRSSLESIGCALRACVGPILAAAHAVVGRLSCLVAPHAHAHTHSAQGSKRRREVMRWVCTQKEQRMLE